MLQSTGWRLRMKGAKTKSLLDGLAQGDVVQLCVISQSMIKMLLRKGRLLVNARAYTPRPFQHYHTEPR